ncbi:unnamed protein product [Rotaria magnacalcarata]|uniref:Uncharacterized protein n=1 Tax=Rotaria magnacalcarata TaxID=392030 RepID=A0A816C2Q6_9BILA|nr:unnamed protein product [Rotaria magnacalcarata]
MNNMTTTAMKSSQALLSQIFKNLFIVIQLYEYGYLVAFLIGFPGNIAGLLTFPRPTLRKIRFFPYVTYDELRRFRSFARNVAQLASPWILVVVSLDRWVRTRFPFKSASICTPKKAPIAVGVLLVIDVGLNSHMLSN